MTTIGICNGPVNQVELGASLRAVRLKAGLKQSWVAQAMGINNTYLCQLESGKRNWTEKLVNSFMTVCEEVSVNPALGTPMKGIK